MHGGRFTEWARGHTMVGCFRDDGRMLRCLVLALITALVLTTTGAGFARPGAEIWDWPVPEPRVLLREFVAPAHRYGAGHRGIDIATPGEVRAPASGIVHFAGTVVDRPVLSISHAGGYLSSFEPVITTLQRGDVVQRGQVVGQVDQNSTRAHCRSPCVHFGVRLDGEYLSPLMLVGTVPRSVLLPME